MATYLLGDCLEIMKGLPDKSIDCFICDLPYGCLTTPRASVGPGWRKEVEAGKDKTLYREEKGTCAWDIKIDLVEFWTQVKRLCKDDHTPVLMFCTSRFGVELINSNPSWFRYDIVWSKTNGVGFLSANKQPLRSHEMIYVFAKKGANYKRVDIEGDFPKGGGGRSCSRVYHSAEAIPNLGTTREGIRCVKSVIEFSNKKGRGNHPTQKPAELYKWLLERYCVSGGTILDPTAGSFSSVVAARSLGLKAIGIEKDATFFWKAVSKI